MEEERNNCVLAFVIVVTLILSVSVSKVFLSSHASGNRQHGRERDERK